MTDLTKAKKEAALEAILFTMGSSVPKNVLATAMGLTESEVDKVVTELMKKYANEDRGIQIIRLEDAYQLCTKHEYYDMLITVATTPFRPVLTEVLLEVLSIVAYKQPVTRGEIERIRGVSCDYAVNRLVEYGLIEECGREDAPGRPILFKTSEEFLRKFGISSVDELPPISEELLEEAAHEAMENAHFVMEGQTVLPFVTEATDTAKAADNTAEKGENDQ